MKRDDTPNPISQLLAALADGELDLLEHPEALAQLAQDPQAAQRIACIQQLKQACAKAMDTPDLKCPGDLAAKLKAIAIATDASATTSAAPQAPGFDAADAVGSKPTAAERSTNPSPILARIGRWAPSAIAAVLLIAATVMFMQSTAGGTASDKASPLLTASLVDQFAGRHGQCAAKPEILYNNAKFGTAKDLDQLPAKLANYLKTSPDGIQLDLSTIGYRYQLTGACNLPGDGAVHIVYKHKDNPNQALSLWMMTDDGRFDALEKDLVLVEADKNLDRHVVIWRTGGMIYYLCGDSLQDCQKAVKALQKPI